jgi:hypothetical protein
MMQKVVDTVREISTALRGATAAVTDQVASLRAAIAAARAALAEASGPLPPPEVIARFEEAVDATAAYWRREHAVGWIVHNLGMAHPPNVPWAANTSLTWGEACTLLGPELKQRFAALVAATPYQFGPPAVERPALLEQRRAALAQLETEEEQLIEDAAASGVVIAHRPEVVARRATEARERELAAAQERDRLARQEQLDRHYATRRVTDSPSLERKARWE